MKLLYSPELYKIIFKPTISILCQLLYLFCIRILNYHIFILLCIIVSTYIDTIKNNNSPDVDASTS